jgi:hypothetical protein
MGIHTTPDFSSEKNKAAKLLSCLMPIGRRLNWDFVLGLHDEYLQLKNQLRFKKRSSKHHSLRRKPGS